MTWLALNPGKLVPTASIAKQTGVPAHYLAKVLQQLAVADLIDGRRGVRGGYRLSRPPAEVTLLDIIRAVSSFERRPGQAGEEAEQLRALEAKMDEALQAMVHVFETATLADLLRNGEDLVTPAAVN